MERRGGPTVQPLRGALARKEMNRARHHRVAVGPKVHLSLRAFTLIPFVPQSQSHNIDATPLDWHSVPSEAAAMDDRRGQSSR